MKTLLSTMNESGIIRAHDYQQAKTERSLAAALQREKVERARKSLETAQTAYERVHARNALQYELRKLLKLID